MTKRSLYLLCTALLLVSLGHAQDTETLLRLARMPLSSIHTEYPNKTGHVINSEEDARLSPAELHPAFYGSFDRHSSVHSHWMLVRTLRQSPDISIADSIVDALNKSLTKENLHAEAAYFDRPAGANFERCYGWAWLLKLDEELLRLSLESGKYAPLAKQAVEWRANLGPLCDKIVELWIAYLPKLSYADRIGTHSNSAFALGFALDWSKATGTVDFEMALRNKALELYRNDTAVPASWEPNATDFFSPSLMEADLMRRVLSEKEFKDWIDRFFTTEGIDRLCTAPTVSDLTDYHIVHLVGLSFSRAWCMASIAKHLPRADKLAARFAKAAKALYQEGMSQIFISNYGGDHWLGTFAAYSFEEIRQYDESDRSPLK